LSGYLAYIYSLNWGWKYKKSGKNFFILYLYADTNRFLGLSVIFALYMMDKRI